MQPEGRCWHRSWLFQLSPGLGSVGLHSQWQLAPPGFYSREIWAPLCLVLYPLPQLHSRLFPTSPSRSPRPSSTSSFALPRLTDYDRFVFFSLRRCQPLIRRFVPAPRPRLLGLWLEFSATTNASREACSRPNRAGNARRAALQVSMECSRATLARNLTYLVLFRQHQ